MLLCSERVSFQLTLKKRMFFMGNDILNHTLKENPELWACPFLLSWFMEKVLEIDEVPTTPIRAGVKKGERYPDPRYRLLLTLLKTVFQKVNMRKYADFFKIHHVTVKKWSLSPEHSQGIEDLASEFTLHWQKKYRELVTGDGWELSNGTYDDFGLHRWRKDPLPWGDYFLNLPKLYQFLSELMVYPVWILKHIIRSMKYKEEMLDPDFRKAFTVFRMFILQSGPKKLQKEELRKILTDHFETENKVYDWCFWAIEESIKAGEPEKAISLNRFLQECFVDGILPRYNEFVIEKEVKEFLSRKYSRKSKKFSKKGEK